jgi:hypothetical protein
MKRQVSAFVPFYFSVTQLEDMFLVNSFLGQSVVNVTASVIFFCSEVHAIKNLNNAHRQTDRQTDGLTGP